MEPIYDDSRRKLYDSISDATESAGIDLQRFYGNSSYFGKDDSGAIIPWAGSHPTLIHWPLVDYNGGPALVEALTSWTRQVDAVAESGSFQWVRPQYWHSTVFSPVHSSDPKVIAQSDTDIEKEVRAAIRETRPYVLNFTRIIVTWDGGVLAVAYASNGELDALRKRLVQGRNPKAVPVPEKVHITLGHLIRGIDKTSVARLCEFARRFRNDATVLGELAVSDLTLGIYHAPFLHMKVGEIFRLGFGVK